MPTLTVRADIVGTARSFLPLDERTAEVVFCHGRIRGSRAGVDADTAKLVGDAIYHAIADNWAQTRHATMPLPLCFVGFADQEAYASAVFAALEASPDGRIAALLLPFVLDRARGQAREAAQQMSGAVDAFDVANGVVEDGRERRELFGSGVAGDRATTSAPAWPVFLLLLVLEYASSVFALAPHFGIGIGPTESAPAMAWVLTLGVGALVTGTLLLVAQSLLDHAETVVGAKALRTAGLVASGLSLVAVAAGGFILRADASTDAMALTPESAAVAAYALSTVLLVSTFVIAFAAASAHRRHAARVKTQDTYRAVATEMGTAREALATAQRRVDELRADLDRPAAIEAAFEADVHLAFAAHQAMSIHANSERIHGLMTLELFLSHTEAQRDAIEVVYRDLRREQRLGCLPAGLVKALTMAALLATVGGIQGCAGCAAPVPHHRFVILDCTGLSPEDSGTPEVRAGVAATWARETLYLPGSILNIIPTASSYSATQEVLVWRSMPIGAGDVRLALQDRVRMAAETAIGIDCPRDPEVMVRGKTPSQSDLLAALAVAVAAASEAGPGERHLLMASDGWLVGEGFETPTRGIPTLDEVLEAIRREGLQIDLSIFEEITLCGLHHVGVTPSQARDRDALWRALIPALHGPVPTLLSTCRGLAGALPSNTITASVPDTAGS